MRILAPEITRRDGTLRLSARIESPTRPGEVWFDVPEAYGDWLLPGRSDAFLAGLFLQAMALGEDVEVEGAVSPDLLRHMNESLVPQAAAFNPRLRKISVNARNPLALSSSGSAVATGFSAGIDSFATLARHGRDETRPGRRVSHLFFNNVGSHGTGEKSRLLYRRRLAKVAPCAEALGLPLVTVDSNLHEVLPIDFIQMHSALNAAVPLLLAGGVGLFFYSSTYPYRDCGIGLDREFDIARMDPSFVPLFSTEATAFESSGCDLSRVEKTRLVAAIPEAAHSLSVCADADGDGGNCSRCFKCLRTMLTLELLGEAERFRSVFDFSQFERLRTRYVLSLAFARPHSFSAELAELVARKGSGPSAAFVRLSRGFR